MPRPVPHELLTPAQMARADAAAGVLLGRLMEVAGAAVARAVARRWSPRRVVVLAGPGNNGGDGWVAARRLEAWGWPVAVAPLAKPREGTDAARAAARWRGPVAPFGPEAVARAGLVVDAIFGAGLTRPLDGPAADALRAAEAAGAPILAVDVPSGLDGATGAPPGGEGYIPRATATVTFARLKPGHLLLPGRTLCGAVEVADIGMPDATLDAARAGDPPTWRNGPALWRARLPRAVPGSHKYARGHVAVVASGAMPGAALLAASAARRAGAGMVTLAPLTSGAAWLLRTRAEPGLIVGDAPPEALLADGRPRAWVLGPGLPPGDARAEAAARAVLASGAPVVADAGALALAAGRPGFLRGAAVLTPHAGEFARLFGRVPGHDRLPAARRAAAETGSVVLLKGADTVIAAPDGRAAVNADAPPSLATAGTGDVLAGVIAALLAGGMEPFGAACAGAWLHGRAAPDAPGVVAEDVVAGLPGALAETLA